MNPGKNILSIASYKILPADTGGQKGIAFFNKHLAKATNLVCVSVKSNEISLAENYEIIPIFSESPFRYINPFYFFKIRRIIIKREITTVIVEHPYLGWLGWLLKLSCGVKLIIHTHNIEYQRFRSIDKWWWRILKWYEGWALRNADYVLCITEEDRRSLIEQLHIDPAKSIHIPYGIDQNVIPEDKEATKLLICNKHGIDKDCKLLFFNGKLNYYPNVEAIDIILYYINPLLLISGLKYKIIIAGKNLPEQYQELKAWNNKHIHYLGFVDDIDMYTKASDVLLNPVISGGGIKTKMIEALGLNTTVISTVSGAAGVSKQTCGEKLIIVEDHNWKGFSDAVIKALTTPKVDIPEAFYREFSWKSIIEKLMKFIS